MPPEPPAYLALAARLLRRIDAGEFDEQRLPHADRLAVEENVGLRVAQEALEVLRIQGRTEGRGRNGNRVRTPPARRVVDVSDDQAPIVAAEKAKLEREGHTIRRVQVLLISRPPTPDEMQRLKIRAAMPVWVTRRRYWAVDADGELVVVHEVDDAPRNAEDVELQQLLLEYGDDE